MKYKIINLVSKIRGGYPDFFSVNKINSVFIRYCLSAGTVGAGQGHHQGGQLPSPFHPPINKK